MIGPPIRQHRQVDAFRAGGQQQVFALDTLAVDVDGLAVHHLGPPVDDLHLVFLQQRGNPAGQAVDDGVFPSHAFADVQGRHIHFDAQLGALAVVYGLLELFGHVDQGLGRDAADIQAGAAQRLAFHEDGRDAQLAGADRRHVAARAAADDQQGGVQCLSHALTPGTGWRVVRAGREWPG